MSIFLTGSMMENQATTQQMARRFTSERLERVWCR